MYRAHDRLALAFLEGFCLLAPDAALVAVIRCRCRDFFTARIDLCQRVSGCGCTRAHADGRFL